MVNKISGSPGIKIWQGNYYDHIIINEEDLNKIRRYIKDNSFKWSDDDNNPENIKGKKLNKNITKRCSCRDKLGVLG